MRTNENTERKYFLKTDRVGFSEWEQADNKLAELLWGDMNVTKYICASGRFSEGDIAARLKTEINNNLKYHVQYWPIFELQSNELIGCCGLRPYSENKYEIGFHLRPRFWRQGYAVEAANAVIDYAFAILGANTLFAGHNPNNKASQKVLAKLGFHYVGDEFYAPTGLYHPFYELRNGALSNKNMNIKLCAVKKEEKIGKKAAIKCFEKHIGNWEVSPSYGSESAYLFWKSVIDEYTDGNNQFADGIFLFAI